MENRDIEQATPQPEEQQGETEQSHLEQTVRTPVPPESEAAPEPGPDSTEGAAPEEELSQEPEVTVEGPEETVAIATAGAPPPAAPPERKRGMRWPTWMLLGLISLVLIAIASGYGGYRSGIRMREEAQATLITTQLQEQFDLAVQDMSEGRYQLAYQRLTYINQNDPNYPGLMDLLVDVQMKVSTTPTATLAPTPTLTPTPDMRGVEELVAQAQQAVANQEWTRAIDTLLSLRKSDPQYQAVMVDDLLYLSYRNRGRVKILQEADLEGGIYDLTLAQRLGPLDAEAAGLLQWASLYITGASFWEIDWAQAVYYFGQVAPALPNLRDGTGFTASERYRQSLVGYGDDLMRQEQPCDALAQYELAAAQGADVGGKLNQAAQACGGDLGDGEGDEGEGSSDEERVVTATPASAP